MRRVAKSADKSDRTSPATGSVGSVGTSEPVRITLSPGAAGVLTELQERIEPRLGPGGDLRSIADWAGRHHGRVARIAGLLHLCERRPGELISEPTMRAALQIGDYLLEHGIAALTGPDVGLRAAVRWLQARGARTVTQRDLHRGPLAGRAAAEDAASLARRLEAIDVLRRSAAATRPRPGRPSSPTYDVHPDLLAADAVVARDLREAAPQNRNTWDCLPEPAATAPTAENGNVSEEQIQRAERILREYGDEL